jgi:hypothetical protein|eukprot:scaffold13328_cov179-Alexandrium_tamarense.AAC.3
MGDDVPRVEVCLYERRRALYPAVRSGTRSVLLRERLDNYGVNGTTSQSTHNDRTYNTKR